MASKRKDGKGSWCMILHAKRQNLKNASINPQL